MYILYMDTITINIDSNHRNYEVHENAGSFSINLGEKIKYIKSIHLASFELPSKKQFPNLYKNINGIIYKNNNYFTVNTKKIEVPGDNYTIDSLLVEINKQLLTVNCKIEIIQNSKIQIFSTLSPPNSITIDFNNNDNINLSLGKILGFKSNLYNNDNKYISEKNFNLQSNEYYFLNINNISSMYSIDHSYRIIDMIPIDHSYKINITKYFAKIIIPTDVCQTTFISQNIVFKEPYDLHILNISLYDSNNNIVDFKNINYSFTLVITLYIY